MIEFESFEKWMRGLTEFETYEATGEEFEPPTYQTIHSDFTIESLAAVIHDKLKELLNTNSLYVPIIVKVRGITDVHAPAEAVIQSGQPKLGIKDLI
jgi:hypothetical protein